MKTKTMMKLKGIALLFFILALTGSGSFAKITSTSETVFIHNISIDRKTKEILVDAALAIDQGILEYLLVGDTGKAYESVLTVKNNKPSELNIALLLIGCRAFPFDRLKDYMQNNTAPEEWQHEVKESSLEISFKIDGTRYPLDALISSREKSPGELVWVYTGGQVVDNQGYKADHEHSYIAIWPDPVCPINLLSKTQNPYKGEFGFEINPKIEVKKNTRIQIIIRKKSHDEQNQRTRTAENSQ